MEITEQIQTNSDSPGTTSSSHQTIAAFRIPTNLLWAIDGYCLRSDTNRSQFIRKCLRDRLNDLQLIADHTNNHR
jgi:hypothetical protein